jgi:8-amino-7-oxononanoate synthase
MSPHATAERALAAYVGQESALLFSSGYAANVGAISAFAGPEDLILSDALNHASIIDGCRLSRARVIVYPHGDTDFVRATLARERTSARRAIVITEAIFSMDGDAAPVASLGRAARDFDAALYVDEAHSLGVLGPAGRGLLAQTGAQADIVLGTLGKSFGAFGAFVATSAAGTAWLKHRARSFVFSTAPPPLLGPVAEAALALVVNADAERARVVAHANALRAALRGCGVEISNDDSPIVPVILGSPERATAASAALLERDVFVQAIRPPTVPEGTSRLRIVPMASHSDAQVARAIDALVAVLG